MMTILLKNQWIVFLNTIRTQPRKNTIGFGIGVLVVGFFLYLFGKFVWALSEDISPTILENLLSFWFLTVIGLIILMGLPQVFKGLYSGSDLEMLFAMPIPTKNIFWMKYIQSYFGTPFFIFTVSAVPIVVFGVAIQATFLYFIVALLVLFAVTIISLSLIFLLNLLLIQVVPAGRANEFMTVMSFVSGIIVYLLIVLPNLANDEPFSELLLSGLPIFPKWIPVSWGSSAIASAVNGSLFSFVPLGLLILLALIMMMFATMLVEKGFRTGWIRLSEGSSKNRRKKKKEGRIKINHPIIAIGKKEWFAIKRDLREWFAFLPIVFFIIFGFIGFMSGGGTLAEIRGHGNISWPIAQAILLFIYALTNGTIASSSIGREGPNLWIMQVMPITGKQMAYGKFWISWLLPFIVVSLIEIVATFLLGWTFMQLIYGLAVKGVITMGMSAVGLWIGTLGAKYNPTNPQQRLNFGASIVLFVLSYLYLFIALIPVGYLVIPDVALNELPQDLNHGITGFSGLMATFVLSIFVLKVSFPVIMTIVTIVVLVLLPVGVAYLFLAISARRIDRGLQIDLVSKSSSRSLRPASRKGGSLY